MIKQEGFTIIELIISIFILSVAVVGIFSGLAVMVFLTANASDRLTASYLAQEGVEIARNMRDTNWLSMDAGTPGVNWYDNLDFCQQGCEADYTTGTNIPNPTPISQWSDPGKNLSLVDGFYRYNSSSSSSTKFKRKIMVDVLTNYALKITVEVFWSEKPSIVNPLGCNDQQHSACSINVEEVLYDWYNYNSI